MQLNKLGQIVADEWTRTGQIRHEIMLDKWVVMPNHFHGIIRILDADDSPLNHNHDVDAGRGDRPVAPTSTWPVAPTDASNCRPRFTDNPTDERTTKPRPNGPRPKSIGALIGGFKSAATKRINELRQTPGMPLWQRNYYEHIVRTDAKLCMIRDYIRNNPSRWGDDRFYGM